MKNNIKYLITIICLLSLYSSIYSTAPNAAESSFNLQKREYQRRRTVSKSRRISSGSVSSNNGNYIRGPRGGCYYINGNGNKTYVDRSLCN